MLPRFSLFILLAMALVGCAHVRASAQIAPMPSTTKVSPKKGAISRKRRNSK